ncbi:efflux RND transporter permease subunit [Sporohalobacter salinus]|uniref:efflux RND transporter permease subunit n=1 Tax=Sporohalobacter salinus TaxID=1494606 RepID=UPI001960FC66|nr:efflux RND transporter permease subunit [Sporohalobacter salinus]MBM7624546.1 multidrug efflux pump subunit AcrB [Sporohalobacter salinus]
MSLTELAIKNKYTTYALIVLLIAAGIMSYFGIRKAENPGYTVKSATIITYMPGASPEKIANLVSDEIEEVVKEIPELDYVESENRRGVSIVTVNLKDKYENVRPVWNDLRRKLEGESTYNIKGKLPRNTVGPFINDDYGDVYGTIIGVTGDGYNYAELEEKVENMKDELLGISDVAKVNIIGKQKKRIYLKYNRAKLNRMGLSVRKMKQILQTRNIILPSGSIDLGPEKIAIEPKGDYQSLEEIKKTLITSSDGNQVYLEDIAKVKRGYIDPPKSKVRVSNKPAYLLGITMHDKGQITSLGSKVKKKVKQFRRDYPVGINFETIVFQSDIVEKKVQKFTANLVQSTLAVILVLMLFLGIREGAIVATLVPVVVMITIFLMKILGIGIDQVSLSALIIALGMLVDNSVVVAESIITKLERGMEKKEASISAGKELMGPLLIASLVTCTAFSPIAFAEHSVGEFTGAIFYIVALALMMSWILALTMVPLTCMLLLKVKTFDTDGIHDGIFYKIHQMILRTLMENKIIFIILVVGLIFLGGKGMQSVPKKFMPKDHTKKTINFEVKLAKGTSIERTEEVARQLDDYIADQLQVKPKKEDVNFVKQLWSGFTTTKYQKEGVLNWSTFIGRGAPRFTLAWDPEGQKREYIQLLINTTSTQIIDDLIPKLEKYCINNFPTVAARGSRIEYMPVGKPVQLIVSGPDNDQLDKMANSVKDKLREIEGAERITDNWGGKSKKLRLNINQYKLKQAGLSNQEVAVALQTTFDGMELTKYRIGNEKIPVVLKETNTDKIKRKISKLKTTEIYSELLGRSVPLKQVADINVTWEPTVVHRKSRLSAITIKADTKEGITTAEVNSQLRPWLEKEKDKWGRRYDYEFDGEMANSKEANNAIGAKLPAGLIFILVLLIIQFNSYRKPLVIILLMPLLICGVAGGLLITGKNFSFMAILGTISLLGIIVNNSIVLIDRIETELEEFNRPPQEAILTAAKSRLRPIFLTTVTTVCGLLPLTVDPLFSAMAVALVFGLIFGLFITLVTVPVMYSVIYNVNFKNYDLEEGDSITQN